MPSLDTRATVQPEPDFIKEIFRGYKALGNSKLLVVLFKISKYFQHPLLRSLGHK